MVHLGNFDQWIIRALTPIDIVHCFSEVFQIVNKVCRTTGGYIYSFENDSIFIAFNATANQANHQMRGTIACKQTCEGLTG